MTLSQLKISDTMLHKSDTPAMHKFHYTRKNKKVYQPADARKSTEKVVRTQASEQNAKNKKLQNEVLIVEC